jgi:hypothetical protein
MRLAVPLPLCQVERSRQGLVPVRRSHDDPVGRRPNPEAAPLTLPGRAGSMPPLRDRERYDRLEERNVSNATAGRVAETKAAAAEVGAPPLRPDSVGDRNRASDSKQPAVGGGRVYAGRLRAMERAIGRWAIGP